MNVYRQETVLAEGEIEMDPFSAQDISLPIESDDFDGVLRVTVSV